MVEGIQAASIVVDLLCRGLVFLARQLILARPSVGPKWRIIGDEANVYAKFRQTDSD